MMGLEQPDTTGVPYRRTSSKRLDSSLADDDQSRGSFMDRVRRAFKKTFSGGGESPTRLPVRPQPSVYRQHSDGIMHRGETYPSGPLPSASSTYEGSLLASRPEEGDSMGSNSTEAPPPVAEIRSSPAEAAALASRRSPRQQAQHQQQSSSRCSGNRPPVWPSTSSSTRPPVARRAPQPSYSSRSWSNNNPSSSRLHTTAVFSDRPNPFVDDSGSYRKEGMPGNGALIPKGGEFSLQRKPTSCAVGTTAPPPTTADVFARMRMLGQKCKNDSGRHKLRRDPVTGKKLLVLR
ncbi:hypothetical protein FOZ60_012814 [Perkinsus olseni]|uniref:Uncharacterized protein n=1 Tax=Perkinsus olseni TaxID=32597 RepID=A0A7J6PBF0_PEROL|nr:hypothetical protein FOZ60_012814 [Perkinsus olseni]